MVDCSALKFEPIELLEKSLRSPIKRDREHCMIIVLFWISNIIFVVSVYVVLILPNMRVYNLGEVSQVTYKKGPRALYDYRSVLD